MNANSSQQNQLANNANDVGDDRVNNDNFLNIITRLAPQIITNDPLKDALFQGNEFHDTNANDFESLLLPAGCSSSTATFP